MGFDVLVDAQDRGSLYAFPTNRGSIEILIRLDVHDVLSNIRFDHKHLAGSDMSPSLVQERKRISLTIETINGCKFIYWGHLTKPNPWFTSATVKSVPLLLTYKNPYLAAASNMAFPTAGSLGLEMSMTGSSIGVVSAIFKRMKMIPEGED